MGSNAQKQVQASLVVSEVTQVDRVLRSLSSSHSIRLSIPCRRLIQRARRLSFSPAASFFAAVIALQACEYEIIFPRLRSIACSCFGVNERFWSYSAW